jgi:hypothetical protein
MQFHHYPTVYDLVKRQTGVRSDGVPAEMLKLLRTLHREDPKTSQELPSLVMHEYNWKRNGSPYYHVYPSIIPCLQKVTLDLPSDSFKLPLDDLQVRFPSSQPTKLGRYTLESAMVHRTRVRTPESEAEEAAAAAAGIPHNPEHDRRGVVWWLMVTELKPLAMYGCIAQEPGRSVEEELLRTPTIYGGFDNPDEKQLLVDFSRLIVGLSLLASDPEIVQPEVLATDQSRYDRTGEQSLVDKAIRRGKFGFTIAKKLEMSPHLRRPHFAIRWTGPGSKVPILKPIKGSVVHREKISQIPTGYEV